MCINIMLFQSASLTLMNLLHVTTVAVCLVACLACVTDGWWQVTAMLIDSREQLIVGLLVAACLKCGLINC